MKVTNNIVMCKLLPVHSLTGGHIEGVVRNCFLLFCLTENDDVSSCDRKAVLSVSTTDTKSLFSLMNSVLIYSIISLYSYLDIYKWNTDAFLTN